MLKGNRCVKKSTDGTEKNYKHGQTNDTLQLQITKKQPPTEAVFCCKKRILTQKHTTVCVFCKHRRFCSVFFQKLCKCIYRKLFGKLQLMATQVCFDTKTQAMQLFLIQKRTTVCVFCELRHFAVFSFNVCTEAVSVSPFVNLQRMATQCLFSLCLKQLLQANQPKTQTNKNRF